MRLSDEEVEALAETYLGSGEYRYVSPSSTEYWSFVEGAVWAYNFFASKE